MTHTERLRDDNESTMPAASTLRMHARAMANVMSPEERCVRQADTIERQQKEIEALKNAILGKIQVDNECSLILKGLPCADASWESNVCGCAMEARTLLNGGSK